MRANLFGVNWDLSWTSYKNIKGPSVLYGRLKIYPSEFFLVNALWRVVSYWSGSGTDAFESKLNKLTVAPVKLPVIGDLFMIISHNPLFKA